MHFLCEEQQVFLFKPDRIIVLAISDNQENCNNLNSDIILAVKPVY